MKNNTRHPDEMLNQVQHDDCCHPDEMLNQVQHDDCCHPDEMLNQVQHDGSCHPELNPRHPELDSGSKDIK